MSTTRPTVTVEIDFTTNLSAGVAYYEKVLSDGPYMWHRLQETAGTSAADASGNGLTGTLAGTYTLDQTSGKPVSGETASRYVNFGADGRVSFTKPPDGVTKLTLEAWAYQATLDGNAATQYVIADYLGSGDWMRWVILGNGKLKMQSGYSDPVTSTAPISAATWYHLAVVMDIENDTITFYVNGSVLTTDYGVAPDQGRVGFQRTGSAAWCWGSSDGAPVSVSRIAEPAMYTDALTSQQILDHYSAATTTPFAGYTWTDVTAYLDDTAALTRKFGRDTSITDIVPMEHTFTLLNRDRRFEPEYATSPYYPNVVPGRPCRVTMTQDATTYDWAFGFIQDFPQDYTDDLIGRVPIVATCMLERMNQDDLGNRQFRQQLAGARANTVLNFVGQPSSRRTIDAGANTIMAMTVESGASGDHMRQVARTDRGLFFFDGAGYAIFQDGSYRASNSRATTTQGVLGNAEIQYRSPNFHAPKALIRNEIVLRRPGGVDQVAVDATSKARYGRQTYSDELLLVDDSTIATRAAALLASHKDPRLRVRDVTFNPQQSTGHWADSLGVKLSDRYTWTFSPLSGTTLSRDVLVEGVNDVYNFRDGEYLSTWFLSIPSDGAQVAYVSAATALGLAPAPTVVVGGGGAGAVRLGVAVPGFGNMGLVTRAAPVPAPYQPKDPVPAVFVYMFSAPPIYNVILQGASNQGSRFQAVQQPAGDTRRQVSAVQQR